MMTATFAVVYTLGYLGTTIWLCRGLRITPKALCLGAMAIAMTLLLGSITIPLPTGCGISCGSWLPLMVLALVYDYRLAMVSGVACGILAPFLLPGWSLVHWAQFFMEYLVVFSSMGYAGVFGFKKRYYVILGMLLAVCLRLVAQVLSGVIFFSQNAWDGWGAWGYSLGFHLSAKIPESIFTGLILMILPLKQLSKFAKGGNNV